MSINDTVIGRVGTIIDLRKKNIRYFERMLKDKNLADVTRRHIESELKSEKDCLLDAMNLDTVIDLIENEFDEIAKEYCR